MSTERIYAPFTAEQVVWLNRWQQALYAHPFNCNGDGCLNRKLLARPSGWICNCAKYSQDWAHVFMVEPATVREMEKGISDFSKFSARHRKTSPDEGEGKSNSE